MRMFGATCEVLQEIIASKRSNYSQCGNIDNANKVMTSFEFVFVSHLMKEILGITNMLYQALQQQSQEILNTMQLVSSTKALLKNMRESDWNTLFEDVKLFCKENLIDIPNMSASFKDREGQARHQVILSQLSIIIE